MTPGCEQWYAGRRVFVTGHTGFKGAWLCLWLRMLGADVTGYALKAAPDSLFAACGLEQDIRSVIGDVRDAAALSSALMDARPQILFHMAAQSLVRPSYADPVDTFATNVMGTAILFDAARQIPSLDAIVAITSDKCYANDGTGRPFAEDAAMGGSDPYSASKGCAELVAAAFAQSYFTAGACTVATARAGNVIGGGDWSVDRIVPDLMRSASSGIPAVIRRPDAIRPWQHVLEPLRGYLMLGHLAATQGARYGGGWNFGPGAEDAVPVRQIVDTTAILWPAIRAELATEVSGPHEAAFLRLDCRKAQDLLGWHPLIDLREALTLTTAWYREAAQHPASQAQITTRQIEAYRLRIRERLGVPQ